MSYDIGDGYYVDDDGNIQRYASESTSDYTDTSNNASSDTLSGFNLADIGKLLSGTSSLGMAGQIAGLGGIGSLLNKMLGGGSGGYAGYQGSIPQYTAQRTQYALPVTPLSAAEQAKVTDESLKNFVSQQGLGDDRIARAMYKYGVTPERMAGITSLPVADVTARYNQALGPNQSLANPVYGTPGRRPGSGGVTYFSPMQYNLVPTVAPTTQPTTVVTEPTTQPTVVAAGGGMMRMKDGGSTTPPETVEQWASRQPDLTKIADPITRNNALESWQMQRPGYVNPMNYDTYEQYAGAANIRDEGGGSGQDLTNRANFYGMTTENYQNALSNDQTKPMGQFQQVYGNELLSPIEQIAAQTARGQGISTMTPKVAALAKANPDVFNAASKKFNDFFTKTYPGTLEYQSVLSGPAQYSSTGVTMPAIDSSASMYILDKATGKIIKNPNYKKKMADGGIASLGGYSDGGQLLRGPGDGVSDDIPATIGNRQPARLADGEFVVPARIVSELGNGSTEAGARKLYAMMDRIKKTRSKAKNIAANTNADKHLPA